MTELRIRCQVLKVIAAMESGTAEDVAKNLPNLTPTQVQSTLNYLCNDDEVRVIGKQPKVNSGGKPWNIYQTRDENLPKDTSKKKTYTKTGRKTHSQELQRPVRFDEDRGIMIVRYREKKIKLLTKLLTRVDGTDKDVLIGCINDYKA